MRFLIFLILFLHSISITRKFVNPENRMILQTTQNWTVNLRRHKRTCVLQVRTRLYVCVSELTLSRANKLHLHSHHRMDELDMCLHTHARFTAENNIFINKIKILSHRFRSMKI
ncbi:hypothetical protein PUN28_017491 [Cardiocondyla obscurior]|uniref:Secreted protein n=1 Tax=Cardiocondyla obscurior TaxID=286306 RepID=A0AAW2ELR7_9HYME